MERERTYVGWHAASGARGWRSLRCTEGAEEVRGARGNARAGCKSTHAIRLQSAHSPPQTFDVDHPS
jgi:hypothetical protein